MKFSIPFTILLFIPNVLCASFPLTAISYYSALAPCAASHLSEDLDSFAYDGCTSATPISAYGSCLCAQRLHSIQAWISRDFGADTECSTTSVQPFLTAFCNKWGVNIGAVDAGGAGITTAAGTAPTAEGLCFSLNLCSILGLLIFRLGTATPGSVANTGQPTPTSTLTSPGASPTSSSSGITDNKITIIASVVGSVAGVIAVVIAWLTYKHMRRGRDQSHTEHIGTPSGYERHGYMGSPSGYGHEMHLVQSPAQGYQGPWDNNFYRAAHWTLFVQQAWGRGAARGE